MFNEKMKYYRKKNLMTQEELAERLHVSRQIITKWESGVVLPSIEYLIDLSSLFSVTIDTLVKDDDHVSITDEIVDYDDLNEFIVHAKRNTYAKKEGKINSCREGFIDYYYSEGKYSYLDSFVGSSMFSGEEVVYEKQLAVWSMNYYGRVTGEHFDGDFLKEVLLHVPTLLPFRGPEIYNKGEYCYHNSVNGNIEFFYGKEEIYYQDIKIYECLYHGGILK